jgi:hypothetical protein
MLLLQEMHDMYPVESYFDLLSYCFLFLFEFKKDILTSK